MPLWSNALVLGCVAFVAMEPITAATHRWVMHGIGWVLHRSHHRAAATRLEANDAFPVVFAGLVCIGFAAGFNVDGLGALVPIGIGVTAYGVAYAAVHDVAIHRRVGRAGALRSPVITRLAEAHRLHHRFNDAPYGMLLPVVPRRVRERVAARPRA